MTYNAFKNKVSDSRQEIYREVYRENIDSIRVKKEGTVIKNFEKIFDAVFKISYVKGFQAMSMRDLSSETGISMGALYGYFKSKDELLAIIQRQGRSIVKSVMTNCLDDIADPVEKLSAAIKTHVYLSEVARPWFFFTFMEARNLSEAELKAAQDMESYTEQILVNILEDGESKGVFKKQNHRLTASLIKAMQQDWYLKRWKYKKRNITVEAYAQHVFDVVTAFCMA